jgi:hypothetical protein
MVPSKRGELVILEEGQWCIIGTWNRRRTRFRIGLCPPKLTTMQEICHLTPSKASVMWAAKGTLYRNEALNLN